MAIATTESWERILQDSQGFRHLEILSRGIHHTINHSPASQLCFHSIPSTACCAGMRALPRAALLQGAPSVKSEVSYLFGYVIAAIDRLWHAFDDGLLKRLLYNGSYQRAGCRLLTDRRVAWRISLTC